MLVIIPLTKYFIQIEIFNDINEYQKYINQNIINIIKTWHQ